MKIHQLEQGRKLYLKKLFQKHKVAVIFLLAASFLVSSVVAFANIGGVVITPATGGSAISADQTGSTYVALTGPILTESASGNIGLGTIVFNAPSGFEFRTSANVTATVSTASGAGTCGGTKALQLNSASSQSVTPTSSSITVTVTRVSSSTCFDNITFTGIRVRPTSGTPLASGNITASGTASLNGVSGSSNFGTLTEVVGAENKLAFTTEPSSSVDINADFATKPVVTIEDKFGNPTTGTDSISLSPLTGASNCTNGTAGTGTITSTPAASGANATSGILTYTAMQYSAAENMKLCASAAGLNGDLSNAVHVAPTVINVTSTTADGRYTVGTVIPVTVQFNSVVNVTGTPYLNLGTNNPNVTAANYVSGSGTDTLTFDYTVASGNTTSHLDYASTSALKVNGGSIKDPASTSADVTLPTPGNTGSLAANNHIVIDTTPPTLSSVSIASNNANTAEAKVGDTVTLSFSSVKRIQTPTVTIDGASANISGGPINWFATYTMGGSDNEGTIPFTIDYTDLAGNNGTQVTATTDSSSVNFDRTQPTVTLNSSASNPTNFSPISITANFSENVTGFDVNSLTVGNGVAGNFAGSGSSYTFDVTPSGQGVVTVDIAGGVAQDAAGNSNVAASQYSDTFDSVQPTVTLTSTVLNPTNVSPIPMTATFSEDVTGFDDTHVNVGNGTLSNFSPVSASVYTFDVTPSSQGTVTVDIPAGVAQDSATNTNFAAAQFSTVYDSVAPTITGAQMKDTNNDGIVDRMVLTFSEPLVSAPAGTNGVDVSSASDHGSCNSVTDTPDGTNTLVVDFSCSKVDTAVDDLTLNLTANSAIADAAGNQVASVILSSSSTPAITDAAQPIVVSTEPIDASTGMGISTDVVVTFSEPMNTSSLTISDDDSNSYSAPVWSLNNTVATVPHQDWSYGSTVNVTVDAADLIGLSVNGAGNYSWSFSTVVDQYLGRIVEPQTNTIGDSGLDLSAGISTATGGNILINNVSLPLNGVNTGDLSSVADFSSSHLIGDQSVLPTKAVQLKSTGNLTLQNTALNNVAVDIPQDTTIFGCSAWDGSLVLKSDTASGNPPSGFSFGGKVIDIGSSSCPMLLDKPVTILLTGVNTPIGYKPAGSSNWFTVTPCTGDFTNPNPPAPANLFPECSITNGTDTKIVTYHFTTYGSLTPVTISSSSASSSARGGSGPAALLLPKQNQSNAVASTQQAQQNQQTSQIQQPVQQMHGTAMSLPSCGNNVLSTVPFTDITNNPNKNYIQDLYQACALSGKTNTLFSADDPITKAELSKALVIYNNLGTSDYVNTFDDVKAQDWFAPYMLQAAKLGIINMQSVNNEKRVLLRPNDQLTRAEAMSMILKANNVDLQNYDQKAAFVDVSPGDWFYSVAAYAQNENLLNDFDTVLTEKGQVRDFYSFPRLLGPGNGGADVKNLKSVLMQLNYYTGQVDNNYDAGLTKAVQLYQHAHKLAPTGTFGPVTEVSLLREYLNPKTISHFRPYDLISRGSAAKVIYIVKLLNQKVLGVSTSRLQQEVIKVTSSAWFSLLIHSVLL